jgi:hypothetical protein
MRRLLRPLWFLLAIVFLVEAWIWDHLGPVVGRAMAALPLEAVRRRLEQVIERLPPYLTLLVFAIPAVVLLPFKLLALWLLGNGHFVAGGAAFLAAKTVGLAVTAFLFKTCKPKLLEIGWFVRFYALMLRLKLWAALQMAPARLWLAAARRLIFGEQGRFLMTVSRLRQKSWRRAR